MGASSSKIQEDNALQLCQERKQFVRKALDGRCALAADHFAYIQSLRNTGIALRKFVEPEVLVESSLYTSTSATPEPPALRQKSISQFSNLSPSLSQHVDTSDSFSPVPSPPSSGHFHVNHMKASASTATTVQEKPPVPIMASLRTSSPAPGPAVSELDDSSTFEVPPPPGTPPWDYFGLFHPVENQFSIQEERELSPGLENVDDIRRLREEEGIPDLEEEGEKSSVNGREDDFGESEDDFDKPSSEPLVRVFKNRNESLDHNMANQSPALPPPENIASENERPKEENMLDIAVYEEADETPVTTPAKMVASAVSFPMNGKSREPFPDIRNGVKDLSSCMKEIEILFLKASDSGKEVPRMLEADKLHFRPLLPEEIAHRSTASGFLTTLLACCKEEVPLPQPPPQAEIKYLTWHRSVSSHSSSSRNPLGAASKDDVDGLTGNIFSGIYMNAGSHASTLDRLYAWERKLYDEVKASGTIRRDYDIKCRLLSHQESRGENQYRIDKTRAAVKDLHSRILVAVQRIERISKQIEELRDNELEPQLEELIGSLTRMWAMMLDCHRHQHDIILLISKNGSIKVSIHSESQRQATIVLEVELNTLCSNFMKWISSHRSYLQNLNSWLHKCVKPLKETKRKRRNSFKVPLRKYLPPPIFATCEEWLKLLDELPTSQVEKAIKDLVAATSRFLPHQEKRHNSLKLASSSHSGLLNGEMGDEFRRNDPPADLSHNCDFLQSSLDYFLEQLMVFAKLSLEKYKELQKAIGDAKVSYERG